MMFWHGGGWAWWQAGLMWLAMIAFLALLIWASTPWSPALSGGAASRSAANSSPAMRAAHPGRAAGPRRDRR